MNEKQEKETKITRTVQLLERHNGKIKKNRSFNLINFINIIVPKIKKIYDSDKIKEGLEPTLWNRIFHHEEIYTKIREEGKRDAYWQVLGEIPRKINELIDNDNVNTSKKK